MKAFQLPKCIFRSLMLSGGLCISLLGSLTSVYALDNAAPHSSDGPLYLTLENNSSIHDDQIWVQIQNYQTKEGSWSSGYETLPDFNKTGNHALTLTNWWWAKQGGTFGQGALQIGGFPARDCKIAGSTLEKMKGQCVKITISDSTIIPAPGIKPIAAIRCHLN